jgi:hypothetical protein
MGIGIFNDFIEIETGCFINRNEIQFVLTKKNDDNKYFIEFYLKNRKTPIIKDSFETEKELSDWFKNLFNITISDEELILNMIKDKYGIDLAKTNLD